MAIYLNARQVTDLGNGLFEVELPLRVMDPKDLEMLADLFPNTGAQIDALLEKEALLGALATPGQVMGIHQGLASGALKPTSVKKAKTAPNVAVPFHNNDKY